MFSGIQEIIVIVLIVLGLILVPRMMAPRPAPRQPRVCRPRLPITWTVRLAIVVSILWPLAWALYFKPWQQDAIRFALIGIGPVAIGWSLRWVINGINKRR